MFTGAATDDVYLWTSLVKQYFVFMCGNAHQEVAFAAPLLRGAAHEWYLGYEKRNGNRPPGIGLRLCKLSWNGLVPTSERKRLMQSS